MSSEQQQLKAFVRQQANRIKQLESGLQRTHNYLEQLKKHLEETPRSITEEIDSIPGRRIFYGLAGQTTFDSSNDGQRGDPINFLVSQDGAFVMTHYPLVVWKPNAPAGATNFGRWSPVSSWPIPTQEAADMDRIDLSYELVDGGSQRNFQNQVRPPGFSRPDNLVPLPVPTLFSPNTTIQFFPTYEDIAFAAPATPTTGGLLVVELPGYRIVNM